MFTTKPITLLLTSSLLAALSACGSNTTSTTTVDAITSEGIYYIESKFSTPRGLPEIESPELDDFLKLAGRPELVASWFLKLLQDEAEESIVRIAIRLLRSSLNADAELSEFLMENSPDTVQKLADLAANTQEILTTLNLSSKINLSDSFKDTNNQDRLTGSATHEVTGVIYRLGDQQYDYDFSEIGAQSMGTSVSDFRIHTDDTISFGAQSWPIKYGQIMQYGIQEVVVEASDPFADSFQDLIVDAIPCSQIAAWIFDTAEDGGIDLGSLGGIAKVALSAACTEVVDSLISELIPEGLPDISATLRISTGDANIIDEDGDRRFDAFSRGLWEGDISFPNTMVPLRRPDQTFAGRRSGARRSQDNDIFF